MRALRAQCHADEFAGDQVGCEAHQVNPYLCQWCPNFVTQVGVRNLCRTSLACGVRVKWDQADEFTDTQKGCLSDFSSATALRGATGAGAALSAVLSVAITLGWTGNL
jgi:hypothetical protein